MSAVRIATAFAVAALASLASAADDAQITGSPTKSMIFTTPTTTLPANAMVDVGCFETAAPLVKYGEYEFQSPGNCQFICIMLDKPVMGLVDGTDCYCGEKIPPKELATDNSTCDTTCGGTDKVLCGGPSLWWVSLSGTTRNRVQNLPLSELPSSSTSSSSSTSATAKSTAAQDSATSTPTETPKEEKSSGPNKAGIAAGVVVGVLALAGIIGGVIFYLRHKRRREAEEAYRRQADANQFIAGGKLHTSNSSMTDSRLDPDFMNRRQSNGSIADNEDYSRRILKVTNA